LGGMARAVVRVSLRPKQRSAPDRREGEMLVARLGGESAGAGPQAE